MEVRMVSRAVEVVTYICWGATALVWALGALRASRGSAVSTRDGRDVASPAAAVLAFAILVSPAAWWRPLTTHADAALIAGLVILLPSTVWTIGARTALGAMWASGVITRQDHQLLTEGPYGVTRHPVYTGILGMLVGTTLALGAGRWIALTIVVTLILLSKARGEERLLCDAFPEEYQRYQRQVPRLIPGIGSRRRGRMGARNDHDQ
jgi:protein-S-isoprenylcysteine O-methyltransferase Ste14